MAASGSPTPLLDDDKFSDSIPGSRDVSMSRAASPTAAGPSAPNPTSALRNELLSTSPSINPDTVISKALKSDANPSDDGMDIDDDGDADPSPTTPARKSNGKNKAGPSSSTSSGPRDDDEIEDVNDNGLTPSAARKAKEVAGRKKAKEERKVMESDITGAREGMEKQKLADSMKRFSYLLGQTELFKHFIDIKVTRDPEFAKMLAAQEAKSAAKGKKKANDARHRKSEKEEDEEMLQGGDEDEDDLLTYQESPSFVKGGKMRDYQVQGLNWMASLHHNGINGILADEMGLGKTLQTIAFLGHLKFGLGITGPHLIVVPKSTLDNWNREVAKWVPGFRTVVLQGTKEERAEMIAQQIIPQEFDILITSYEMCLREKSTFKKFSWQYIIIDEAHRIKNVDSLLSQIIRVFTSRGRLLITGTPLQNNLQELWALLNFILPDVFSSSEDFDNWFQQKGESADSQDSVVAQLHKVLAPFLLRRVKADVEHSLLPKKEINLYVGMSDMQRKWYKSLLEKDIDAVNGATGKKEGKTRLLNIMMQLRKCCNHPYLFDGAEPGPPFTTDEHLVDNAGKMLILDKLLKSMKEKGSRVLIFSQMSRVLDILEDYCHFREYKYCRIDGGTNHEDRIKAIDEYNAPESEKFIFLLTTRAGGLGINLVTADVVVLFDSDWNPQADLQAMDRAHRIGQTKQVYVFRFITQDAVEERILERATQKLKLDQLVIQEGRAQQALKAAQNKDDLVDMIQHGAAKIINGKADMLINDDIDEIIRRGEAKTTELNAKYAGLDIDALANFKSEIQTKEWEGTTYEGKVARGGMTWIELEKRTGENKTGKYNVDGYFKETLNNKSGVPKEKPKVRPPKQVVLASEKFYPPGAKELQTKEMLWHYKTNELKAELPAVKDGQTLEDAKRAQAEEQEKIDNAVEFTEEDRAALDQITSQGFERWNKRTLMSLTRGMADFGKEEFSKIRDLIQNSMAVSYTVDEVRDYAKVFWERGHELEDFQKHVDKINVGEKNRDKKAFDIRVLDDKIANSPHPLQKLEIAYAQNKGKHYSEEEDRFLLVRMHHYGLIREDCFDLIKRDIGEWPLFRFDWFIKSRTPEELKRRGTTLLLCISKDYKDENAKADKKNGKKRPAGLDNLNGNGNESASDSRGGTPASTSGRASKKQKKA